MSVSYFVRAQRDVPLCSQRDGATAGSAATGDIAPLDIPAHGAGPATGSGAYRLILSGPGALFWVPPGWDASRPARLAGSDPQSEVPTGESSTVTDLASVRDPLPETRRENPDSAEKHEEKYRASQERLRSRRSAYSTPPVVPAVPRWLVQTGSMAAAAAGLVLAVALPGSGPSHAEAGSLPLVTADVSAPAGALTFDGAGTESTNDPEARLKEVLKVAANKVSPAASKGTLSFPIDISKFEGKELVTSRFGPRADPLGRPLSFHYGIDFGVGLITPVKAAADGTVIVVGYRGDSGNIVTIQHDNGFLTSYLHNFKFNVQEGQRVKRDEIISYSGDSGAATGPHLHFEVRQIPPLGSSQDPDVDEANKAHFVNDLPQNVISLDPENWLPPLP